MTRAAKIAAIHTERAGNASVADNLRAHLSEVGAALSSIDRIRADLLTRVEDDASERLSAWAVPLRELSDRVAREQSALERVLARLRRPTLNIGVVGRAGQGKSRFLQSLTGLTSREIPDGSGRFCTGVPSLVQHVPGTDTYANVFLHSAESFLAEVIGPYYEKLRLGPPPAGISQFSGAALPPLPSDAGAEDQSAYGHLSTYHTAFPEYGPLIGAMSPRRVPAEEIRRYVAQDDVSGRQQFHDFRAVRRVDIATSFPHKDLGGIGVIDLPGLGDTNLGDSRVLLSALQDDVDIVLFLRRPAPERDGIHDFDVSLYGLAKSALPEIPMERRSFLILNHRRSTDPQQDNLARAKEFHDLVAGSAIRVAGTAIADCSSAAEVMGAFDPIVDYLLANIGALDRLLLDERTRRVAEIHQEARLLVRQISTLGALAQPTSLWFPVFQALFGAAYQDLSVGLDDLVERYRDERDSPDQRLAEAVSAALKRARDDDGIPSSQEIKESFSLWGSRAAAYGHLLDETRAHLSRHFLELDTALQECVERMWRQVADVLRQAGQLGRLIDRADRDFLVGFADRVPPGVRQDSESEVRFALQIVTGFELSYRGFVQHRIRPCLDGMHADQPTIPFPQDGTRPDERTVREMLEVTYREALYGCESALQDLLAEPNRAVFAIVEEFRDRVLRSHGVQDEWRAIYEDIRAEIWADKFAALAEKAVHLRTWNDAVQALSTLLQAAPQQANTHLPQETR